MPKYSENALNLIKKWEGLYLDAYLDPVGIPTIGYGTVQYPNGKTVKLGDKITQDEAEEYLRNKCDYIQITIKDWLPSYINQNQLDAIISFCYNLGVGAFASSTLRTKLNNGDIQGAANEFDRWVYATKPGGTRVKLEGLVNRRADEKALFLSNWLSDFYKTPRIDSDWISNFNKWLYNDNEESNMPNSTIIKITNTGGTWLKTSTAMASTLADSDKYFLPENKILNVDEIQKIVDGHYPIELTEPINGRKRWFLYVNHAGLVNDKVDCGCDKAVTIKDPSKPPIYQVRFTMDLSHDDDIIYGLMEFIKDGVAYNKIIATSSLPGRQYSGAWNRKGGLIPPTSLVKRKAGTGLTVKTTPIYMPHVAGVSGNFYPIAPFEVQTDGDLRGDWGIHRDANVPGSMGCIVTKTPQGWQATQREFAL